MTERELQDAVIGMASLLNWMVLHQRPARTQNGWRTAVQGNPGFPDLVMVRNRRMIVAELKAQRGQIGFDQATWLNRLKDVPGVEDYVWYPADWECGRIEVALR
jgi:hypothetical protein